MTYKDYYTLPIRPDVMPNKKDNQWMRRFHAILKEHFSDTDLDNEKIASLLGMSQRQFYRKVKAVTNKTPNQYIRAYRLKKAKTYLEQGRYLTVREVCFAVGYLKVSYFDKQFAAAFGKKPLTVLKENGWR